MLENVLINNMALIREAEIDLSRGLNILTGETGAGKSIIISAINLALGDKADRSMIRKDADYGAAQLLFTNVNDETLKLLDENDIERDGENIIISRKITNDSSTSRINGCNVTLNTLRKITATLVDIHGQHDHQSLMDASKHIDFLDSFAGDEISEVKSALKFEFDIYRSLRREYKEYDKSKEEFEHEITLAKYELNEIDSAAISEKEDVRLEEEFKFLSQSGKVMEFLNSAFSDFSDASDSIGGRISHALKEVDSAYKIDNNLAEIKNILMDLEAVSKDAYRTLNDNISAHEYDAERFDNVKNRLDEINHLKTKYGNSLEKINEYRNSLEEKIRSNDDYFKKKSELEVKIHNSGEKLNDLSARLSAGRKKAAKILSESVKENLKELNFLNSDFSVDINKLDKITENGFDGVEFMISTNPGEPLLSLAKIASGGEISRIMLAIKSSVAKREHIETLIFDEIDSGISGKAAQAVADKLYDLSKNRQVICISHLPQIAAMADVHFHIHKEVEDGNTISGIEKLDDAQMIKEIATLLGGSEVSHAAIENAKDLKGNANFKKRKLT